MLLLTIGLLLFLGVHLVPAVPATRNSLRTRWGEQRYKGIFSLASGVGFIAIIAGYWIASPGPRLFAPMPAAIAAAPWVVTAAFVLFAASHMRGHLRRTLQHPMVIGTILWSAVHLLANGDLRGTLLFGAFLAWSVIDLIASLRRGPIAPFEPIARQDLMALVGGTVVSLVLMALHRVLFGVPVVGFGL